MLHVAKQIERHLGVANGRVSGPLIALSALALLAGVGFWLLR